ncbi:MAG: aldehyde dehydrogenase [Paenibacillus sp.]|nr:aldehyde dehydrogenase [Paenibacillus sp.]
MNKSMFINGEWVAGEQYAKLLSPYSGERLASIPVATVEQTKKAIEAAYRARTEMARLPAHKRSEILEKVSDQLQQRREEAARIIALEAAKPISAARVEVKRTIETYKYAAEEAKRITGEVIPLDASTSGEGRVAYTVREPLGVVGAITPFNFPMNLVAHKVGPAIAAGNTVVLKPANQTPLSALFIAELFAEAGLPAGALNVVTGSGSIIGDAIVTDERVQMITFTGSPEVGLHIRGRAGLKRVTLELGSNSALIVDRDVDLSKRIKRCVQGAFSFQGQVCISLQRIYVHRQLYEPFLAQFIAETKKLKAGNPLHEDTDVSALITPKDTARLLSWIAEAQSSGAEVVCGGTEEHGILQPTIMVNVRSDLKVSCQEAFGPIVLVDSFDGRRIYRQPPYGA